MWLLEFRGGEMMVPSLVLLVWAYRLMLPLASATSTVVTIFLISKIN